MVLLVEKDLDLLSCYEQILTETGILYFSTTSPQQAMDWLQTNHRLCGLVITNFRFRDNNEDSLDLAFYINKNCEAVPVVLITGQADIKNLQDLGLFTKVLQKPVNIQDFLGLIKAYYRN